MAKSSYQRDVNEALRALVEAQQAVTFLEHCLQSATALAEATGDNTAVDENRLKLESARREVTAARNQLDRVTRNSPKCRLMRLIKRTLAWIGHALGFPADTLPVRLYAWQEVRRRLSEHNGDTK